MDDRALKMLQTYLLSQPPDKRWPEDRCDVYHFCSDEENANECARLVLAGDKRATTSLAWSYDAEGEPLPEVGQLNVITDWDQNPLCIIKITAVETKPFGEVDAEFAFVEGEGDKSLDYWRRVHWDACSAECHKIGRQPSEDMPVVLERFKVVYRATGT